MQMVRTANLSCKAIESATFNVQEQQDNIEFDLNIYMEIYYMHFQLAVGYPGENYGDPVHSNSSRSYCL